MFEVVIYDGDMKLACKFYTDFISSQFLRMLDKFLNEHSGWYVYEVRTLGPRG